MMHGQANIKFTSAKQAKEIRIRTPKEDCTKLLQATGRQHRGCIIPQAVTHSLVLLKMGEIIARNMLSLLELLIRHYCCI